MSSRRRPLHTCGVSFLAIARNAGSRAQNLDGRLGSTTRKMVRIAKLVNPLIFVLKYHCLMVLSFIDDRLLAIENMAEKFFPSSTLVLDKIEELLHLIETFPLKFDDAVDKLPCFNQVLFLDWAVTHVITLLKFMINILMNWGRDVTTGEKEILVDMNYNKDRNGSESADKSKRHSEGTVSSVSETQQAAAMDGKMKSKVMTYKEVLKMGTVKNGIENGKDGYKMEAGTRDRAVEDNESCEKDEKMEESVEKAEGNEEINKKEEEEEGVMDYENEEEVSNYGSIETEEDILELFETAWLMKPTKKGKENGMSRSASFM